MSDDTGDTGILAQQLARTRETWRSLLNHGVREGDAVALDFFYDVPSYSRANELKAFLEKEAEYSVGVTTYEDRWTVRGTTQSAKLSLQLLEQWVSWMVTAGLRYGALFDGWGAEVP